MKLGDFKVAQGLDGFRVANYVGQAAQSPEQGISQLTDTIDEATTRHLERMNQLNTAYENLAASQGARLRGQIGQVPAINQAAIRDRLVAAVGAAGGSLLTTLFDKAVDSALSHYGRLFEDISNRVLQSVGVYAEMFFRSDQIIIEACAAYLAELMVSDMRDISNEMGSIEQVLVRINAIAKDLEALDYALRGYPNKGPEVFRIALRHVKNARTAIAEGLMAIEDTGAVEVGYVRRARHAVRAAQDSLPKAPIGPQDLQRFEDLLSKLDGLRELVKGFSSRIDIIVARYLRVLGYAAVIRSLPASLFQEARLLKSLTAELALKGVDSQLSTIEDRIRRYASRADMEPAEVYHHATLERLALEFPYMELLTLERLFYNSNIRSSSYEALLEVLEDPFFKGDPFKDFKSLVRRYTGMSSRATMTTRMLRQSTRIMYSYRSIRTNVASLISSIERAAPRGPGVTAAREAITGLMKWIGVRNPMMVVSSGLVVVTLLSKRAEVVRTVKSFLKTPTVSAPTIDAANALNDYMEGANAIVSQRVKDLPSNQILEPLSLDRPFFRTSSDALTRSRVTTEAICTIRTDGLVGMDISQVITNEAPQYDEGRARGLKQMVSQPLE